MGSAKRFDTLFTGGLICFGVAFGAAAGLRVLARPKPSAVRSDTCDYAALLQNDFQEWARQKQATVHNHIARALQPTQLARLSFLQPGQGIRDLPDDLRPKSGYSGAYGRLTKEMLAPTITRWVFHPGSGRFGHPVQSRVITIREAARLQAFPDRFYFTGTYIQQSHQIGNAVPPLLVEKIGRTIALA